MLRESVKWFVTALAVAVCSQSFAPDAWSLSAADQAFQNKKIIARWKITGKGQIDAAYKRGVDILEDHPNPAQGFFTILVDQDELNGLTADGYDITVLDPDCYASYASKSTASMGGFLTFLEGIAKLDSFYFAYPNIVSPPFSIGQTYSDREMMAVKISDNPEVDEDEPEILFTGLHHAREPIGAEINLETIRRLLFNYGTDTFITRLVNEREIYFLPYVNPDGYLYNESQFPGGGGMWRKNRRLNAGGSIGVDLNRNYGYEWGYDDDGSSPVPSTETYRGSGPFSEPEMANMRAFVNSREFTIAMNYHSYSNLFLWPPGYAQFYTPDEALFRAIGDVVVSYNNYTPQPGWALYTTNGGSDDWMYYATGEHPKILSFTPEVGAWWEGPSPQYGFWPYPENIPGLIEENIGPNLFLIDLAETPDRLLPPEMPEWVAPDTVTVPDYNLQWSDPGLGGINQAVSYNLRELWGPHSATDDAEAGNAHWNMTGFSSSASRHFSGTKSYYGGIGELLRNRLVSKEYYRPGSSDQVTVMMYYETEAWYDFVYVEASSDYGQSWATLPGSITTNDNPTGLNRGNGITGTSGGGFVEATFPLGAYAGQYILLRVSYETDDFTSLEGVYVDDFTPVAVFDSISVLGSALTPTEFAIQGRLPGDYQYSLSAKDTHEQTSAVAPPHQVTVDYAICACDCHADPECDGVRSDVLDVVNTINIAFRGASPITDPNVLCPFESTDTDCSGATDVLDVVRTVNVAFRGEDAATEFCNPCP